ncbi:hypothetical protein EZV62_025267 [Acer yangbiense]|uniref:phytol kinase n=1 Tax=Acer yangbiense TaxID=1000413 RepID=A0A5C7GYK5_9ROSI|nr:hypothetical protein EZV62_025267 [Acer yangbiense]
MTTATLLSSSSSCSFTLLRSRPTIIRRHVITTTTHHHPLRFPSPNRPGLVCRERYYKCRAAIAGDLLRDVGATAAVLVGAYGLVRSFDSLTKRNIIQQVCFCCFKSCFVVRGGVSWIYDFDFDFETSSLLIESMKWVFDLKYQNDIFNEFDEFEQKACPYNVRFAIRCFLANFQNSTSMGARYFASFIPLVNCLRLIVHGLSLVKDEGLIKSVTREGKPEELLKGPLYYVLILTLCTVVFWRESPIGVVSLGMMCAGDGNIYAYSINSFCIPLILLISGQSFVGFADIIGRRFGSMKIFYNPKKSWAGSISMFISGFLISSGYISKLHYHQPN